MARKPPTPVQAPPKTAEQLRIGIKRLHGALERLDKFDVDKQDPDDTSELTTLTAHISDAVDRAFTEGTSEHSRYSYARSIHGIHTLRFGGGVDIREYRQNLRSDIGRSRALLTSAVESLERDLEDLGETHPTAGASSGLKPREFSNKVFIVHGRSGGPKVEVARFLESIEVEAIILHEQPNRGRSTIEKIEAYGDVDFAVVIFTPDDVGSLEGEDVTARPRQNVLFELGYFIAKLGRANVCVLRQGEMEMLSDYIGPIWIDFDDAGAWKMGLATELQEAGFNLDWNQVMGRRRQ